MPERLANLKAFLYIVIRNQLTQCFETMSYSKVGESIDFNMESPSLPL